MGEQTSEKRNIFPCSFQVIATGEHTVNFMEQATNIILRHYPECDLGIMEKIAHQKTEQLSLVYTVNAENRMQLENLYIDLKENCSELISLS